MNHRMARVAAPCDEQPQNLSEQGVKTRDPVIALTSSPRNLTDRQLDAIRDVQSSVGVVFAVAFPREDGQGESNTPLTPLH